MTTSNTNTTSDDVAKLAPDPNIKGGDGIARTRKDGLTTFDTTVIGQTGLNHASGFLNEELLIDLRGPRGRKVFQEMADNCPVVGSLIFAMQALFRSVEWTVQAKTDDAKGEEGAKFVEEIFDDMDKPMDGVMTEIVTMFVFGFAPLEILYKRRVGPDEASPTAKSKFKDNKIGIRALPMRAQPTIYRWEIDDATGEIKGMWQQPISGHLLFIPIEKLLLFRTTDARNNPEGRSILRNAYRPWYFKKRIEEIEAIGVERDLAGLPVARIPSEYMDAQASPEDKAIYQAYLSMVRGIKRDRNEGIVLPSDTDAQGKLKFDLTLLSTAGSRATDTSKILDRYDRQIAMSALADFIFLGQGAVGSFALSSDKTALFGQALGAFLKAVAGVLNRVLLPKLWQVNAMDPETMPTFHFEDVENADLAALSGFVSTLAGAGAPMFPDRDLENHLRDRAGLPPAPEEGSEDFDLRGGQMPGMALGIDGKPLPGSLLEQQKAEAAAALQAKGDKDKNGTPDKDE